MNDILFCDLGPPLPILTLHCIFCNINILTLYIIFQRYYMYNILFCDLGPPLPILTLHCTSRNQYQSVADNIETDAHTYPYAKRPCLRYHQYHLLIINITYQLSLSLSTAVAYISVCSMSTPLTSTPFQTSQK